MKAAELAALPGTRRKSVLIPLNTTPVGVPGAGWLGAFGTTTTPLGLIGISAPAPVNSCELPSLLFETHHGLEELRASPQGFFRCTSVGWVGAGTTVVRSDTRLTWL